MESLTLQDIERFTDSDRIKSLIYASIVLVKARDNFDYSKVAEFAMIVAAAALLANMDRIEQLKVFESAVDLLIGSKPNKSAN